MMITNPSYMLVLSNVKSRETKGAKQSNYALKEKIIIIIFAKTISRLVEVNFIIFRHDY